MFRAHSFQLLPLRTRTLPPARHTNCVLAGRSAALVIDPGSPYRPEQRRLLDEVGRLQGGGGRVAGILLTHHHDDHASGAAALCQRLGAPLLAHPGTLDRLGPLPAGIAARAVTEGERLEVDAGVSLELLHTPGHAPGHLCPWEPGQRVLVSGDMVLGAGTTLIDPGEGDMATYMASLERLRALGPRLILPGHGPVIDDADRALKRLITHRKWREWKLLMALEPQPRPLADLTAEAYQDLPSPLAFPLALRSAEAHLIKLERDGRAVRHGPRGWSQVNERRMACARRGP